MAESNNQEIVKEKPGVDLGKEKYVDDSVIGDFSFDVSQANHSDLSDSMSSNYGIDNELSKVEPDVKYIPITVKVIKQEPVSSASKGGGSWEEEEEEVDYDEDDDVDDDDDDDDDDEEDDYDEYDGEEDEMGEGGENDYDEAGNVLD
ncbi:nucleolin-like [Schistocerca nitens]|uniref:nucleolin-like n=1 Tax=Schistocerca nitens TaxID=7011 RepID=UPI002117BE99|nr:nucleolin-like [Schistocerca nitens]